MTSLHLTSCLICSVVPEGASSGVPEAGLGDTGPAATWAAATPGIRTVAPATAAARVPAATAAVRVPPGAILSKQRLIPAITPPRALPDRRGRPCPGAARCPIVLFYVP